MKRTRLLSVYRAEFRRKEASYKDEVSSLRWVRKFLDKFSIEHSSQIRQWQVDVFIAELRKKGYAVDDLFQSRSSLRFLMEKILQRPQNVEPAEDESPGVFRVTG